MKYSGVFTVNFELISHLVLVFLLWSFSMYLFTLFDLFYISIVFRFHHFRFHPFLEPISKKYNIFTKWNAKGIDLSTEMENAF